MQFSILTLFPEMFDGILGGSILRRAQDQGHVRVQRVQIRNFARDRHRSVDDYSFGGGPGMVLRPDVLERALNAFFPTAMASNGGMEEDSPASSPHVIYLSPQGRTFTQQDASRLARMDHVILICGHYEGVDERFVEACVDEELSIGDYVLTGGEIPAMVVMDAVVRLVPGVLGDAESFRADSFYRSLLDHPHYTRPARWVPEGERGAEMPGSEADGGERKPPAVLLSGNHRAVDAWRRRQALLRTLIRRPDLLMTADLNRAEARLLAQLVESLAQDLDEMGRGEP